MALIQRTPKCPLNLCLEAIIVLLVCVLLISRIRLFLIITAIINLGQYLILSAFFKNLKSGSKDFFFKL